MILAAWNGKKLNFIACKRCEMQSLKIILQGIPPPRHNYCLKICTNVLMMNKDKAQGKEYCLHYGVCV